MHTEEAQFELYSLTQNDYPIFCILVNRTSKDEKPSEVTPFLLEVDNPMPKDLIL